jgi:hypothetical protein
MIDAMAMMTKESQGPSMLFMKNFTRLNNLFFGAPQKSLSSSLLFSSLFSPFSLSIPLKSKNSKLVLEQRTKKDKLQQHNNGGH